jgi:hypothetical protein
VTTIERWPTEQSFHRLNHLDRSASPGHPSREIWRRFANRMIEADSGARLAAHLQECDVCQATMELTAHPFRRLGRPIVSNARASPDEIEAATRLFVDRAVSVARTGGVMRVAADERDEPLLLHVLGLTVARLQSLGYAAGVFGSPRGCVGVPSPSGGVAVLWDATSFDVGEAWKHAPQGSVRILAEMRRAPGNSVPATGNAILLGSSRSPHRTMNDRACPSSRIERWALSLCAAGIDIPPGFFSSMADPELFPRLTSPLADEILEWRSFCDGQFQSRQVCQKLGARIDPLVLGYLETLGADGKAAADRARRQMCRQLSALHGAL